MRYSAPAAVRSALRKGLALVRDGYAGKGLRGETVRWAERLADGDPIDYAKAKKMRAWFARHGVAKAESARRMRDPHAPSAVAWLLWGADPSIPYRVTGWQDPIAPWLHGVLAEFESKRSGRRAEKNGRRVALEKTNVVNVPVFHGTNRRFGAFDLARAGSTTDAGTLGLGIYFTDRLSSAESYANWSVWKHGGEPLVIEARIRITNPYVVSRSNEPKNLENDPKAARAFTRALQRRGHDGIVHGIDMTSFGEGKFNEYVVFDASQVTIVGVHAVLSGAL